MNSRAARTLAALLVACVSACADDGASTGGVDDGPIVVHLAEIVDASGEGTVALAASSLGQRSVEIHLDGAARVVELDVVGSTGIELASDDGASIGPAAVSFDGGMWLRPRPITSEVLTLTPGDGATAVTIHARGAPVPEARRERSLVWSDPLVLDDPEVVGARRVLEAAADDGRGGVLLDTWFRRFATTLHSERAAPAQLMDELAATLGSDPATWDLDALPFKVTGVHNRLDLAARGGGCGELRVSLASTHPTYAPLHLLFLFRQEPREDDVAPDGVVHCLGTARRWSRLSLLDGEAFVGAARAVLDEALVHERFLLAESVELTVSPWEWRQWKPVGPDELDNPALFQTVATPALNVPGPLRDSFLAFVEANADGLLARTVEIPIEFRGQSARVPPSAPAERLSLDGLDPAVLAARPGLAEAIEVVGCPTCHTTNAKFVQTNVDRTFSDFYDKELDARGARLDAMHGGDAIPVPPFGPLQ